MVQQIIANGREKVVNRQIHRLFWKESIDCKITNSDLVLYSAASICGATQ